MRAAVADHVGLPVCVGIAPTKTLAKFATRLAKQNPWVGGVCPIDLMDPAEVDRVMRAVTVTGRWGVAGRLGKRLNVTGIHTVADLKAADPTATRNRLSVVLQRTLLELNVVPCNGPELEVPAKRQISFSRSFVTPVTSWEEMRSVLSRYTQQGAIRPARDNQHALIPIVFADTSHFNDQQASVPTVLVKLPRPGRRPGRAGQGRHQRIRAPHDRGPPLRARRDHAHRAGAGRPARNV